jgi:hypothetical protein
VSALGLFLARALCGNGMRVCCSMEEYRATD